MGGDGRSVLVVDDDGMVRSGLTMLLESWGFAVLAAASLGDVRDRVPVGLPDLILTDLYLGGDGGGFEVVEHVRAAAGAPVPAIILTGVTARGELEDIRRRGLVYLVKPIGSSELQAAIRRALDGG